MDVEFSTEKPFALANTGLEFSFSDRDGAQGTVRLGKAKLKWREPSGKTWKEVPVAEFLTFLSNYEPLS